MRKKTDYGFSETIPYDEIIGESEVSYCVKFGPGHEEWLPKMYLELNENKKVITMPLWLYENRFR